MRRLEFQDGLASYGIDSLYSDFDLLELGEVLRDRRHQVDLAFFRKHHDGDRGDGFGHREDAEDSIGLHRGLGFTILIADGLAVNEFPITRDYDDSTWDIASIYFGLEKLGDACEAVGGESGFFRLAEFAKVLCER